MLEQRQKMGGLNASQENNEMIAKQIRTLENRLDKVCIATAIYWCPPMTDRVDQGTTKRYKTRPALHHGRPYQILACARIYSTPTWRPTIISQALVKFNESLAMNKNLRERIDTLRRERVVFDSIYKKLERELHEKKKVRQRQHQ